MAKKNYFQHKTVWITGASSGLGEQLAYDLSKQGAKLILSARRINELERVKQNCTGNAEDIMILPLDLMVHEAMPDKVKEVLSHFGKVDVLINNGGVSQRSYAIDTAFEVDKRIMDINFFGTVALTKALLPSMIQHQLGHIAVISSIAGKVGVPKRTAYAASKFALVGFFDALRAEVHQHDIKVTMICPGFTQTNIAVNALIGEGKANGKQDPDIAKGMSVKYVCGRILKAIKKNREEVYIGGREVFGVYVRRLWPKLFFRIARGLAE